jgi:DNA-binding transcriptional regulator YhcF (GntR family)
MTLRMDAHSPIPIRRQLTEPLTHVIEGGGVPRDLALPCIPEFAGFADTNPSTVARVIEDLKRSGYRPLRPRDRPTLVHFCVPTATGRAGGDGEGEVIRGSH